MRLPIFDSRERIIEAVKNNKVTILVGETGSGKTTQLPIFSFESGLINGGILGVTQPRIIAAMSVSEFVAGHFNEEIGGKVGYKIRFDDKTADDTKIKFMTDGILLRELQADPMLSKYSIIMVDEAHERSQNIDFILGLLKELLTRRDDLKVIVTSATIDEEKFSRYFWDAPIINVSGRTYPVKVDWSDRTIETRKMNEAIVEKILDIHVYDVPGDILVFVAGVDDINAIMKQLDEQRIRDMVVLAAYGDQDPREQRKIFGTYPGKRKVVIATNIAETSITLDGTVHVVDSGLIKQTNFHPETGIQSLDLVEHSQSGCDQRKGRAGRTQPGFCHRMYTDTNFNSRPKHTTPEILRVSLANVVLMMEDIGIENILGFDFIDKPNRESFKEAYETLIALGAIRKNEKGLTPLGKRMARLPLDAKISRMLIEAEKHGCVLEVATVAAFISAKNIYSRPKGQEIHADNAHARFKHSESDALTYLHIWKDYEKSGHSDSWCFENYLNAKALSDVCKIRKQILEILGDAGIVRSSKRSDDEILKSIAMGLAYDLFVFSRAGNFAFQGVFRDVDDIYIHPSSSVFGDESPKCMVAAKIMQTAKSYARMVTRVKPEWLSEIAPEKCRLESDTKLVSYDQASDTVIATKNITLKSRLVGKKTVNISVAEAETIQFEKIRKAETEGAVALRLYVTGGQYGGKKVYALYKGEAIDVAEYYLGEGEKVEDGASYYCKVELFIGDYEARPMFKVVYFPMKREKSSEPEHPDSLKKEEPKKLDLTGLHQKWGKTKQATA